MTYKLLVAIEQVVPDKKLFNEFPIALAGWVIGYNSEVQLKTILPKFASN